MTRYVKGQFNCICERCGHQFKSADMRKEWTGLMVCAGPGTNDCWEVRHPQDFVRGVADPQTPPWTAPKPAARYVSVVGEVSEDDLT